MNNKNAREIMREHQSGFVKLNPRWCAIEKLIKDSEKLDRIEQITNKQVSLPEGKIKKIKKILKE